VLQEAGAARNHRGQHGNRLLPLVGVTSGEQAFFSTAHGSGRTMSRT
jgi:RNA-splicing ligase RtcB